MKAYPEYKDSGNIWIGQIPSNWGLSRLKFVANVFGRIGFRGYTKEDLVSESEGALTIGGKHIQNNKLDLTDPEYISWEKYYESPEIMVSVGDILITQRGSLGKSILIEEDIGHATINPSVVLLKNIQVNKKFLYYFLCSDFLVKSVELINTATAVPMISQNQISAFNIVVPSAPEQQAIADFLDRKTAQIDTLIEKKQRQIDLLQEQRTALINHAVTKGLNPNVKMKGSGVEWLGNIPSHWDVKRLKYLASITTGERDTVDRIEDGKYPFFVRSQTVERINSFSYDGEAVLTAGDGVGVAKVFHYINGKFDFHQRVYKFSDFIDIQGKFFFYYIKCLLGFEVLKLSAKSTVDSLRLPMFQNFPMVLPPKEEQNQIIEFIETKEEQIETTIQELASVILLLQEYRTALISEAVTGKIDVRTAE